MTFPYKHDAISFLITDLKEDIRECPTLSNRIYTFSEGADDRGTVCYLIYIQTMNYNYYITFYPEFGDYTFFHAIGSLNGGDGGSMNAFHRGCLSLEMHTQLRTCLEDYFERPLL